MKGYNSTSDYNYRSQIAIEMPNEADLLDLVLAPGIMQRISIPATATIIEFGMPAGNIRAKLGDGSVVAAIPSATSALGSGNYVPNQFVRIPSASPRPTHIAIIAAEAMSGHLAFWA